LIQGGKGSGLGGQQFLYHLRCCREGVTGCRREQPTRD
jgi:hypothetical protein